MKVNLHCVPVLLVISASGLAQAQQTQGQQWIKLTTPGLELYTDSSAQDARNLIRLFENADSVTFHAGDNGTSNPAKPLRVIAFANADEYAQFRLSPTAFGHYLHARDRDYIVLADTKPEHYQAAVHEYTHYSVNSAGLHLPLWLNEGIADLYSTSDTSAVGGLIPGRLATLNEGPWLRVSDLLATQRGLSVFNDARQASLFYAESWALTHMLAVDPTYASRFPELLTRINNGVSSIDAISTLYGKSPEQLEGELTAYVARMTGRTAPSDTTAKREHVEPHQRILSDFESRLACADLLTAHPFTALRAKEQLLALQTQYPGQAQTEELLGHIAWTTKHSDEAKAYWAGAIEHGSHDFEALYQYALLLHADGAPKATVIALVERALAEKPDNDEAIYNLGVLSYNDGRYEAASNALLGVHRVPPAHTYTYYSVLAYCHLQLGKFEGAKSFLLKARESARTSDEQSENSRLLQFASVRTD